MTDRDADTEPTSQCSTDPHLPDVPVMTDAALQDRVEELIQRAFRRQLWTLFFDDEGYQLLMMPMADYPGAPDGPTPEGTAAQLLANRVAYVCDYIGATRVAFAWERRGPEQSTPVDREWACGLAAACRNEHVEVWSQFIVHDGGVRWFARDDDA